MSDLKTKILFDLFSQYSENEGFCLLESDRGRSLIFLHPYKKLEYKNSKLFFTSKQECHEITENLWVCLNQFIEQKSALPQSAGFFAYEFLDQIEQIQVKDHNNKLVPDFIFYKYAKVIELSVDGGLLEHELSTERSFWSDSLNNTKKDLQKFLDFESFEIDKKMLRNNLTQHSNFSSDEYLASIEKIKELILDGEVYQVNLSQQFKYQFKQNPSQFYFALRKVNPAPYSAFIKASDFYVISASPEKFLSYQKPILCASPIKGTRPRLENKNEDLKIQNELKNSSKDLAELAMIVDLMRNDFGKIAKIGSVEVKEHARLESYAQVHHLVSDIQANVKAEIGLLEIFKAIFPSGSITGAPKIAAMKIISELENCPRGVYTGAIGYFAEDSFCFNVAIRTATIKNNLLYFQAGGAIVLDSNAESEYEETINKALSFLLAYILVS